VDYTPYLRESKPGKRIPTFAEVLWGMFNTKAHPPVFPRQSKAGYTRTPEWEECQSLVEAGLADYKIFKTPVLSVNDLAFTLGRDPIVVEKTARSLGLYVIGKRYRIVTKVPLMLGERGPAVQQDHQLAENRKKASVIGTHTTKVLKVLEHKTAAQPLKVEVVRVGPDPGLEVQGWRPGGDPMSSINRLLQMNRLVPRIQTRNVKVGKLQMAETLLSTVPPGATETRPWLKVVGASSKSNAEKLFSYIQQTYSLVACAEEEKTQDWTEIVEKEERARVYGPAGQVFVVKDMYLLPIKTLAEGPWVVDRGFVYIGGVLWKQRRSETLNQFLVRTRKALADRGFEVDFESLKSLTNGQVD
jgi:hypothetical protein